MGLNQSTATKSNEENKLESEQSIFEERAVCVVIGSAFIEEIGSDSSLFELSSLPLLFREFRDDCLKNFFSRPVGTSIFAFGKNEDGQLGLGDKNKRNKPEIISSLNGLDIVQIACGENHSLALLESGEVLSWGSNQSGQLGIERETERLIPTQIPTLKGKQVIQISCGNFHSLALTEEGVVYSWGGNEHGQLGLDSYENKFLPNEILVLKNMRISKIFCGYYQSFAISSNGDLFVCGANFCGQLGIGNTQNKTIPKRVDSFPGNNVTSIVCGDFCSLILTEAGEVYFNSLFQSTFQLVSELSGKKIVSIGFGSCHCVALQDNGNLYVWGSNNFGQLGFGDKINRPKPEKLSTLKGKNVLKISCGASHNIAFLKTGEIVGWGWNNNGQLGIINNKKEILVPTIIPLSQKVIKIDCSSAFSLVLTL